MFSPFCIIHVIQLPVPAGRGDLIIGRKTIFAAAILLTGCSGDYHRDYLEDLLEVKLPCGTSNVEHFTGSDIAFTSHYTLPSGAVMEFASATGMLPEPPVDWGMPILTEELPAPWETIPDQGTFHYASGSSGWNRWDMILNEETGDLWTTVYYTDASGDHPE